MSTEIETGPDRPDATTGVVAPRSEGQVLDGHAAADFDFNPEQHVYEPHRVGLPALGPYIRELWRRREFAFELSRTTLRAQHFQTAFGQLWLVLNPLLLAAVYFLLIDIVRHGHKPPGFFAHLVGGIFAYYFFAGAVREGAKSVTGGGKLVLNTAFPRLLLPLSTVITSFKRFVPTFVIYIPIQAASGLPFTIHWLWVPVICLELALIAAGMAAFVAALQVYFRDVKSFLPYLLRVWMYASPVLYYANEVPNNWEWLIKANPIASPLAAWSTVLQLGHTAPVVDLAVGGAWAVGLFVVGSLFFMSREREFAVRI